MEVCYKFKTVAQSYYVSQGNIPAVANCNGWTAVNKGDTVVRINDIPLLPFPPGHPELSGESTGVMGNIGEVCVDSFKIFFDGGANPWLVLIQKFYV